MILVEGESDRIALETLAERLGLPKPDVTVLGGAHAVRRGPIAPDSVALCDEREARLFVGAGIPEERVFVCRADLEDELIRALGTARAEQVFEEQGELGLLRILQQQPAHRERTLEQHLHGFINSHSRAKARYAKAFVEALDLDSAPEPLRLALLAQ